MKHSHTDQYRQTRLAEIKQTIKRIRVFPIPLLLPVMLLPFFGHGISLISILLIPAISYWIYREMRRNRDSGTSYREAVQEGWRQTKDRAKTDARFRNLLIIFAGGLFCLLALYPPLGILGAVSAAHFVLISPDLFPAGKNKIEGGR
jgi:hypothetical protein